MELVGTWTVCSVVEWSHGVSRSLSRRVIGPLSTRYGFPSGNSLTAPIDASATVTPVSCEDAFPPPPHRAGLWTSVLWILSTPNAEELAHTFASDATQQQRASTFGYRRAGRECVLSPIIIRQLDPRNSYVFELI